MKTNENNKVYALQLDKQKPESNMFKKSNPHVIDQENVLIKIVD
jgi:hypothetical protein